MNKKILKEGLQNNHPKILLFKKWSALCTLQLFYYIIFNNNILLEMNGIYYNKKKNINVFVMC